MRLPEPNGHVAGGPADRILAFVRLVRANGIPASPAEAADACRAFVALPEALVAWETFEAVLAASLVKRAADLPRFRELFDAYFFPPGSAAAPTRHAHHHHDGPAAVVGLDLLPRPGPAIDGGELGHQHGTRIDLRRFFGEGVARPDHDHHPHDRLRLTWLGGDLRYDQAGGAPPAESARDASIGLARVQTDGQPGALRPPHGTVLPRRVVLAAGGNGRPGGPPVDEGYNGTMDGNRRPTAPADHRPADGQDAVPALPDLSWDRLSAADLARLERALTRLGRKLGGAPGQRRAARRGRLDGRLTARRAAATGGVPFAPVYRARRNDRPRLVVLCDASLSVRGAARFLLALARSAQRQGGRVRSFVFVREVAEATAPLGGPDLERAIAGVFGGRLIDTAAASDGGAALAAFRDRHGALLTPRTTLLILGDGRNNGCDPRLDVLGELCRRCRRVIWLTPEGRGSWRLAGCDLPRYEAACDLVATVRTPADLERVVAALPR